jgi:hypothetical protein
MIDDLEIIGVTDNLKAKPIYVTHNPTDILEVVWDKNPEIIKDRCPIQLVEDRYGDIWIALLRETDLQEGKFKNIIRFACFVGKKVIVRDFVKDLMTRQQKCNFMIGDIIRNPSIKEYKVIETLFRRHGFVFNKKKNKFQKIG